MKTLLTLFVLLFSTSVFADDISDFQIEGMSIGDSLLDYFSESEIYNNLKETNYTNKDFLKVPFHDLSSFEIYESLIIYFKNNDDKYKIFSISGRIYFDMNKCFDLQNTIVSELKVLFKKAKKIDPYEFILKQDKSKKSFAYVEKFVFKSDASVAITCYDWSDEIGYSDFISVNIRSKEFQYFLSNDAWK